jgi:hypothetical protein
MLREGHCLGAFEDRVLQRILDLRAMKQQQVGENCIKRSLRMLFTKYCYDEMSGACSTHGDAKLTL